VESPAHPVRQPDAQPDAGDTTVSGAAADPPERITSHNRSLKKLGPWTTRRRFEVRATRSLVVLDLLLPRLAPGAIDILLDVDHSTVKLLVPDGAVIDGDDLRRVGRGRLKDWTGTGSADGQLIRIVGEMRSSEVRIHRGGVAVLQLLAHPRSRRDARQAHREGRLGAPSRSHRNPSGAERR